MFDLDSNRLRPAGWTSADGAGLPMFPGLIRYDEVGDQQAIRHALRFTVPNTRRAYVPPARHVANNSHDANLPPMGMRVRLRAGYNIAGPEVESGSPPGGGVIGTTRRSRHLGVRLIYRYDRCVR